MKRVCSILVTITMALLIPACKKQNVRTSPSTTSPSTATVLSEKDTAPPQTPQDRGEGGGGANRPDPPPKPPKPPAPSIPLTPQPPTTAGVRVFGDWPPTGRCDFTLPPTGRQGLPNPDCNDTTSGIDVPFGMSLEICEHDGSGSAGLGKCRRFLPGMSSVGDDMNDKGTTFVVDRRMIGYLNSADFPVGIQFTIGLSGGDFGSLSAGGSVGYDGTWLRQDYNIPLPSSCPNPKVVETTKSGDAEWGASVSNNVLRVGLRVKPKAPFGANNWVGVEILCQ